MDEFDDFEIISETCFSQDPTFELIDVNGKVAKDVEPETPTTPETVLPLLIPKPIPEATPAVVEKQIVNSVENLLQESKEIAPPVIPIIKMTTTTITTTTSVSIKPTTIQPQPTQKVIPPVPSLPPAPPLQRYGDAALIPHNLDMTVDVNAIKDNAKQTRQYTLIANSEYKQQQQDIQTILEQRRRLLNNN